VSEFVCARESLCVGGVGCRGVCVCVCVCVFVCLHLNQTKWSAVCMCVFASV